MKFILALVLLGAVLVSGQEFLLKTSEDGQTYFVLRSANHEVVLASETYKTPESARNGIVSVLVNGNSPKNFEKSTSKAGEPYFLLKAQNGETIGNSEMYKKEGGRNNGIEAVSAALKAVIDKIVASQVTDVDAAPMKQVGTKQACSIALFSDKGKEVRFRVKGGNGEIILASEGYTDATGARNGISSVLRHGGIKDNFDIKPAANGEKSMTLVAGNNKIIGVTETLKSTAATGTAKDAIAACVRNFFQAYADKLQILPKGADTSKTDPKADAGKTDAKPDTKSESLPSNAKQQKLLP